MSNNIIFNQVTRNICSILINRPAKRNALNHETFKQLQTALDRFENDDSLNVGIIAGVGGTFCAGYDLDEFILDRQTCLPDLQRIKQMRLPEGHLLSRKVLVAAIDGHAAGVGYELALKCNFRVAERESRMGFLNRRFGIPIMNGGTVILPDLIGKSRAMELIATGKAQLAPEALQYGVIHHIADIGCALGRAINFARSLAKFHQPALVHDIKSTQGETRNSRYSQLFELERSSSLCYLENCGPLESVAKFLSGELYRHGNFDMGNLISPTPEVTL